MSAVVKLVKAVAQPVATAVAYSVGGPVAAAAVSAAATAAKGGGLGDIVKSGVGSALGGYVGNVVGGQVASEFGNTAGKIAASATSNFTGTVLATGDVVAGLKSAVIGGATSGVMSAGKSIADTAFPGETTKATTAGTGVGTTTPTSPFGTTEAVGPTSPYGTVGTLSDPSALSSGAKLTVPTSPWGSSQEVSKTSPFGTVGTLDQPNVLSGGYPGSTYSPPFSETSTGKAAQDVLRTQVSSTLADLFKPTGSTAPTSSSVTSTGQAGTTPGTQALGQALRVDPGATLGGGDQTKPQQNVWNLQSLRVKDETGS